MLQGSNAIAGLRAAHRSFATRIADISLAHSLDLVRTPRAGDLCLAKVTRVGHHRHVELVTGRRAALSVGDTMILAFGHRYATDQFEAVVPATQAACHLAAAGGIAATVLSRHADTRPPTEIMPLGVICDSSGVPLNLERWGWPGVSTSPSAQPKPHMILVAGTSMNAGKTTVCCQIIRTLNACGLRAGALKLTGTGSGGDLWRFLDSGAHEAMDFGNVGLASTAGMDARILDAAIGRLCAAVSPSTDIIVAELADGLLQRETSALLQSSALRNRVDSLVFAASDPLGAIAGIELLSSWDIEVAAVSGLMCASPLAVREFRSFMSTPVIFADPEDPQLVAARLLSTRPAPVLKNAS